MLLKYVLLNIPILLLESLNHLCDDDSCFTEDVTTEPSRLILSNHKFSFLS